MKWLLLLNNINNNSEADNMVVDCYVCNAFDKIQNLIHMLLMNCILAQAIQVNKSISNLTNQCLEFIGGCPFLSFFSSIRMNV